MTSTIEKEAKVQGMPQASMQNFSEQKPKLSNKWKIVASVSLCVSILLLAALVTVIVLWKQEPAAPTWLRHNTVIRSVTSIADTPDQDQAAFRKRSVDDGSANYTMADRLSNQTVEMTSVVLSTTADEVKILVLLGTIEENDLTQATSRKRRQASSNTNANDDVEDGTDEDLSDIQMLIITANPNTGDVDAVKTSQSAADSPHFVNTGLLVAQQLLVDTTAIASTAGTNANANAGSRKKRNVDEDCSRVESYGTVEYCETTQRVEDNANEHVVYRKQYSNLGPNSRHSRNDQVETDEDSDVNVDVSSYVSKDTGLLVKGDVTAEATLNVFAYGAESQSRSASETKYVHIRQNLHTDFNVDSNGISREFSALLDKLVSEARLVEYDQSAATSKKDSVVDTPDHLIRAKRDINRKFDYTLFRVFGQSVRVVASASVSCCSAHANALLYYGSNSYKLGSKDIVCNDSDNSATTNFATHSSTYPLATIPTPVGVILVYMKFKNDAGIFYAITRASNVVFVTVEPQTSSEMSVYGGWNFLLGEVGASASIGAAAQIPVKLSLNQETCEHSISASLVFNVNGKYGLYYKVISFGKKCKKFWKIKICIPWISFSKPKYLYSTSIVIAKQEYPLN